MFSSHAFKRMIYQFDMFCSSQLLRYRSETQYKTLTGGLLSLVIICVVIGGFANMLGDTLNRVSITSSLVTQKQSNPPLATLRTGRDQMFMMGFSIQSFDYSFEADLVNGPQYFSIELNLLEIAEGVLVNRTKIPLQQCTHDHWKQVPQFQATYDRFGLKNWLCLPLESFFILQGSLTSYVNTFIGIQVLPCQNSTFKKNCAPQEDIESLLGQYQNFYMSWNYINPVINPNQQDFIQYYVEGGDYVIFSSSAGSEAWVHFSDYTITSDDSIWPYAHTTEITGCIVEQKGINHPYSVTENGSFARIYLAKSENSLHYTRQVQKISAVISYIGGLIGAMTAVLFLIKFYTDASLEVTVGLSLFEVNSQKKEADEDFKGKQQQKQQQNQDKNFNFIVYARMFCYRLLRFCGWIENSDKQEYLKQCQQEALKQMDIEMLLRRVIKLQTCISNFFTSKSLQKIKQELPITLKSAKKMRTLLLKQEDHIQNEVKAKGQINLDDFVNDHSIISEDKSQNESETSMNKDLPYPHKIIQPSRYRQRSIRRSPLSAEKESDMIEFGRKGVKFIISRKDEKNNMIYPESVLPPIRHKHG